MTRTVGAPRRLTNASPLRRGDALTEQVLSRAGRYRTVNERLQIKEVVIGDGERRLRYVVCFNPEEAARQQAHRYPPPHHGRGV